MRVVAALIRVSLATAMAYRSDFLFDGATGLLRTAATVAPVALVFTWREEVAGWNATDAASVMGFWLVMHGVLSAFIEPNLGAAVESIRNGSLDLLLLRPADAQLLVSLRRIAPGALVDLPVGLALVGLAAPGAAAGDLVAAAVLVVCGLLALYGLWLLAICASFVFVRVDNVRFLLWAVADAGRWPRDVFSGAVRLVLTVVVPVAVATSLPAEALAGRWSAGLLATGFGVAVGFLVLSRVVWLQSLRRYASASS
jgi:ABC-2 type transport system permease protein